MSDVANLNIVIGANVSQAQQGLNSVSKKLGETAAAATKVDSSIGKSSQTFLNLGRVIQDLPFGFTAIQNNITQLIPATGALGLAFSAVIAAISFAQVGTSFWTRGLKDNTKAVKENTEEINKDFQATGRQIEQVAVLVKESQLLTTTHEQQNRILQDLSKISEEYFGQLKVEGNLIAGLNSAYQLYIDNILSVAKAKGAQQSIEKLTQQLLAVKDSSVVIDNTLTNLNLTFKQSAELLKGQTTGNPFKDLANASEKLNEIVKRGLPTFQELEFLSKVTGLSEEQINELLRQRGQLKTKELQLNAQILSQAALIAQADIGGIQGIKDKVEKVKDIFSKVDTNIKDIPKRFINAIAVETGDALDVLQRSLDKSAFLTPKHGLDDLIKGIQDDQALKKFNEQLNTSKQIAGEVADIFSQMFIDIATTGKISFRNLAQEVIRFVGSLIRAVIEAAVLKAILSFLNPVGAGASQINSIVNALGIIPHLAGGGVVTKPTLALVGESGPEAVVPLGQLSGSANNVLAGEVEFTISGQNLRGVLKRADRSANTFQ